MRIMYSVRGNGRGSQHLALVYLINLTAFFKSYIFRNFPQIHQFDSFNDNVKYEQKNEHRKKREELNEWKRNTNKKKIPRII